MSQVLVPRLARGIVVVVLASFAVVYVLAVPLASVVVLPVFGLQLAYVMPGLRRLRGSWLLALQAALGFAAPLLFGSSVGILGFVAGSLLLASRWPWAVLVVGAAAVLAPGDAAAVADVTISMVLTALVIYGLTRLTERVDEVYAARLALAMAAVARERLHIAAELNDGLGQGLAAISTGSRLALADPARLPEVIGEVVGVARRSLADARTAAAGFRALSLTPELTTARALLATAGVTVRVDVGHTEPLGPAGALLATVLREAVTEVVRRGTARTCAIETTQDHDRVRLRVTNDGARTAGDESLGDLPGQVTAAGGTLVAALTAEGRHTLTADLPHTRPATQEHPLPAPGRWDGVRRWAALFDGDQADYALSVALLSAVLVGFSMKALLHTPTPLLAPVAAVLSVVVVMQLRSVTGRHMSALALMALLTYAPMPVLGSAWLGIGGFLTGPILLAFPARVALPLVAGVLASIAAIGARLGLPLPVTVNFTVSALVTGLVIYGLVRLAQLVKELQAAREELARAAVVEERLRAARDLHDLLGHSLAAILLKCELARRLDPVGAAAELADVLAMTGQAEADLRAVSGDSRPLSLTAEAGSARSVLAAAGIEVSLDLAHDPLPAEVETVLSTVLREAVTNVLRHSAARHCAIETLSEAGTVRLRVRNDESPVREIRRGSAGLGNLTTRLAVLDGQLGVQARDGWFELDALVPVPGGDVTATGHGRPRGADRQNPVTVGE